MLNQTDREIPNIKEIPSIKDLDVLEELPNIAYNMNETLNLMNSQQRYNPLNETFEIIGGTNEDKEYNILSEESNDLNEESNDLNEESNDSNKESNNSNKESINSCINLKKKKTEGLLEVLKNKYDKKYIEALKEYNRYFNNPKGVQKGGTVSGITLLFVVLKLILMTIGTYIFSYFPCVFGISLMCLYMEYKLTKVLGYDIMGMPLLYMICAFCCPCCWTCFRLFKGWKNKLNVDTGNLFNIMSNCSQPLSILDIYNITWRSCKEGQCYTTRENCYNTIFPNKKNSKIG